MGNKVSSGAKGGKDNKAKGGAKGAKEGSLPADSFIIFVLGGPGSGKGTQCDRLKAKYPFVHLSAGDLLRDEVKSGSDVGKECERIMKEGALVPMEVTIALLKKAMIKSGGKKFLVDGFPRALDQAEAFERDIMPCKFVLFFDCPEETMEARLLSRGQTSGRSDDNIETIRKRFNTFVTQSLPVKDHYAKQNKAYVVSSVPGPDEVFAQVDRIVKMQLAIAAMEDPRPVPADADVVFVLGGPGSGKGTQCDRLKAKYPFFVHLSAGDLLRDEVRSGSDLGKECEAIMKEGALVPMEVTIALLKKAMIKSGGKKFLIDGFPRALDQAEAFEKSILPSKMVLFFDCPEETMEARLLSRGQTSGRSDDNAETIRKRFNTFVTQSLPVKDHFEALKKAFVVSSVPGPDEVFAEVDSILSKQLALA